MDDRFILTCPQLSTRGGTNLIKPCHGILEYLRADCPTEADGPALAEDSQHFVNIIFMTDGEAALPDEKSFYAPVREEIERLAKRNVFVTVLPVGFKVLRGLLSIERYLSVSRKRQRSS